MKVSFLVVGILVASFSSPAFAQTHCKEDRTEAENLQMFLQPSTNQIPTGCSLRLNAIDQPANYRAYTFAERGAIQITATFHSGHSIIVNSQTFWVFPRRKVPSSQYITDKNIVRVTTAAGDHIDFYPGKSAQSNSPAQQPALFPDIAAGEKFSMSELEPMKMDKTTGITAETLPGARTLLLDCGFGRRSAFLNPTGKSTFRDASGNACSVTNSSLFAYRRDEKGQIYEGDIKFDSTPNTFDGDSKLFAYLKSLPECRDLQLPTLPPRARPANGLPTGSVTPSGSNTAPAN